MREAGPDERVDDLNAQVGELGSLRTELQGLNRTLLRVGAGMIGMIVTMALGFLSVIVTGS